MGKERMRFYLGENLWLSKGRVTLFHNATCTKLKHILNRQRVALHGCNLAKSRLPVTPSLFK